MTDPVTIAQQQPDPHATGPVMPGFKHVILDVDALSDWPDALHDIYCRRLDLMVVRGLFPAEQLARAVQALDAEPIGPQWILQETRDPKQVQMRLMGESLTPNTGFPDGPDMDHYFASAAHVRARARELFAPGPLFEPTVQDCLTRLAGGRAVSVPTWPDGRSYTPATIRSLPPGCQIPVHVGNYFLGTGGYRHLATQVALEDQLSYFLTLQAPQAGGALEVYSLEWKDPATPWLPEHGIWDGPAITARYPALRFTPQAGDLLLFDGGRYYHKVTRVEGTRTRWTMGGFAGFSRDMQHVYYWN